MTLRIAMWSGPRNLSTAMMRAFENRSDCCVWDEPFYAAYLATTGIEHPMRAEIMAACETDPAEVATRCGADRVEPLFYQKHMTQHMVADWLGEWVLSCRHAFLVRAPERVLASYVEKRQEVRESDIGFRRQLEMFEEIRDRTGLTPPVIEAEDVRRDPEGVLKALCAALGIVFDPAMLSWPAGRRDSDGIWAAHWYNAVEKSTGFSPPPESSLPELPPHLQDIAAEARPAFEVLQKLKIQG